MTTAGSRQYSTLGERRNGGQKWEQEYLAVCVFTIAEINYVC